MAVEVFNRCEKKFIITEEIYRNIRPELEEYMEVDAYSRNGDFYTICNIYYDTPDNQIIRRSIEKPAYKEKLRLRSYGMVESRDKVYLEIKKKYDGIVNKRRISIPLEDAYRFIQTREKPKLGNIKNEQVINEIDYMLKRYPLLQPTLYLSYDRNAMFGIDNKEFRITFDTNIRTRREELSLEKDNYGELLLPPGLWIMEAKISNATPLWFAELLSKYKIYPTTFSKYGTEYQKSILHRGVINSKSKLKQISID
ncbi:MAG: polyphosphate polymerase domain-containing protein [Mobilitalea sp.]